LRSREAAAADKQSIRTELKHLTLFYSIVLSRAVAKNGRLKGHFLFLEEMKSPGKKASIQCVK
jgi:hypothetical protein